MAPLRDPLAHASAIADALSRAEIGNEVRYPALTHLAIPFNLRLSTADASEVTQNIAGALTAAATPARQA